jgi:hypothetical protein
VIVARDEEQRQLQQLQQQEQPSADWGEQALEQQVRDMLVVYNISKLRTE